MRPSQWAIFRKVAGFDEETMNMPKEMAKSVGLCDPFPRVAGTLQ
jgi:hypothetical protein